MRTVGELKELLENVADDATFIFSVDVSTGEHNADNRLQSDFVEPAVERDFPGGPGTRVIFSLYEMDRNFTDEEDAWAMSLTT